MPGYNTIVVGTDLSETSEAAVEGARKLAEAFGSASVHLLHVVNTSPAWTVLPYGLDAQQMADATKHAEEAAAKHLEETYPEPFGDAVVKRTVRLGIPAREMAEYAASVNADVLLVSTHGYGAVGRTVLGSVATNLIRVAHCPVLVVGPDRAFEPKAGAVLAAVDMSPVSQAVVEEAMDVAKAAGSHVWISSFHEQPVVVAGDSGFLPRYVAPDELDAMLKQHERSVENLVNQVQLPDVEFDVEVANRAPAAMCILERAEILKPALIVLGTSGRNAWKRMLLGSTAGKVVSEAVCPVLVVPFDAEPVMQPLHADPASA